MRVIALILLSLGVLLAVKSPTAETATQRLELDYQIFVGGFETGRLELILERTDSRYRLISAARTLGVLDALIGFHSTSESSGRSENDTLVPLSHTSGNQWMGESRSVKIAYGVDGPTTVAVDPPPEDDDRDPVTRNMQRGTLDALSAALAMSLKSSRGPDRCNTTVRVFDGRRRYNIIGAGVGPGVAKGPVYVGPAYQCHLDIERIAGHSKRPWMPRSDDDGGEIWLSELSKLWPPIPVRFESDIGLGSVVIHLTRARGADFSIGGRLAKSN